jgi:hypothetical protein
MIEKTRSDERPKGHAIVTLSFDKAHVKPEHTDKLMTTLDKMFNTSQKDIRLLLDIDRVSMFEQEARNKIANRLAYPSLGALALVASKPIPKLISGFIANNIHNNIPVKVFPNTISAEAWLSDIKEN